VFPRIDYVGWVLPRIDEARHDLGSSDLHPVWLAAGVVRPRLTDLVTPERTVRSLVAAEYGVSTEEVTMTANASSASLLAAGTALAL
jgi:hypothetical protein